MLKLIIFLTILSISTSFFTSILKSNPNNSILHARKRRSGSADIAVPDAPIFTVGEDLPQEVLNHNCIYDMILVERFHAKKVTDGGLLLPEVEGKDQKHVAKVLSMPTEYGLESEQGRLMPISEIAPFKVGDIVYVRDPWGIGPKNIEVGDRCFSFHKADHITALLVSA